MSDKFLRDEKQNLVNSIGSELSWGWSPAVDFVSLLGSRLEENVHTIEETGCLAPDAQTTSTASAGDVPFSDDPLLNALFEKVAEQRRGDDNNGSITGASLSKCSDARDVHILLAGASDLRHVLRTLASLRVQEEEACGTARPQPTYHFHLYEPNLRTHCRHLFFLQWLLDSMFALEELEERVLMFLEVFGNTNLRELTAAQFRHVAQRLLQTLQKQEGAVYTLVSFSEMKLKERDFVEEQLLHWVRDASQVDLYEQWSKRVQQEMADRYDNRDNLIDWDFVFGLTDYTSLLRFPEYRTWRNTGIAFDVSHINPRRGFVYEYTVPNKSLCHFDRRGRGVYRGDIKNGPFFSFGVQTENEHICKRTTDGTCKYGNGVVSMHNVRAWLYTLMTGLRWPWSDHAFAWDDPKNYNYLPESALTDVAYHAVLSRTQFHFIGLDFSRALRRAKEVARGSTRRWDAAFVGTSCTQMLTSEFFDAMQPHGVAIVETAKFVIDAGEEAKKAFVEKIELLGADEGWRRDDNLTRMLHGGQPPSRVYDGTPSPTQQLSSDRYNMPFHVALTRDSH